jgi:hypothetical protein
MSLILPVGRNYKPSYKPFLLLPVILLPLLVFNAVVSVLVVYVFPHLNALIKIDVMLVLLIMPPNVADLIILCVLLCLAKPIPVIRLLVVYPPLYNVKLTIPALIGIVIPLLWSVDKRRNRIMNFLSGVKML